MKSVSTILLGTLFAVTLGCGYSAKQTPPTAGTMPAISQLSPNQANAGDPAFTLTVDGSNFASKAVVNWNGTGQATTFVSGGQLTIAVPSSALTTAGTVKVTVTNPGTSGGMYGGGTLPETSTAVNFTIN